MSKYLQVFKTSWADGFVYRLNFIMWRVRSIFYLFTVYFLWFAIFTQKTEVFGYQESVMLTYILGTAVLRSFVLASRSEAVGAEIATGDLNNYLVKPINYFLHWFSRDLADKLLNFIFIIFEISLIILIFRPAIVLPTHLLNLGLFLVSVVLALFLFFFFNFMVGMFAFWYPEHNGWPLRFIILIAVDFLAGSLFPLDIFPQVVYKIFRLLPPAYFLFYPMQIYLGRLSAAETGQAFGLMIFWLIFFYLLAKYIWQRGLRIYAAYGR
jgi:ABC-2 type transport system permease protein